MKAKVRPALSPWKSSSRKSKRARGESWVERLEPLGALREVFSPCHRAIARAVFDTYVASSGTVLEIGAGIGQLGHWLDGFAAERCVHTDPDRAALAVLARRFPEATLRQAHAEALPFDAGSVSAVVGLCVLDVVPDPEVALHEIRRVLAPGGVVVHLLDMAPRAETELAAFAAAGEVVLPNLFADPSSSTWPEDMLVSERPALRRLLSELARLNHPLPHVFGHYFDRFEHTPFDAAGATREYETFSREPRMRDLLKQLLTAGYTAGYELGLPPPRGRLVSTGRRLAERLGRAAHATGFAVELNEPRTAWAHAGAAPLGPAYRSIAFGHERRGDIPERLLCADAVLPGAGQLLLEAGMLVTVLRRTA